MAIAGKGIRYRHLPRTTALPHIENSMFFLPPTAVAAQGGGSPYPSFFRQQGSADVLLTRPLHVSECDIQSQICATEFDLMDLCTRAPLLADQLWEHMYQDLLRRRQQSQIGLGHPPNSLKSQGVIPRSAFSSTFPQSNTKLIMPEVNALTHEQWDDIITVALAMREQQSSKKRAQEVIEVDDAFDDDAEF
ncbi:hypothetical protein D9615_005674 [Tricholomella constricta]|uniref:Uncharacterized protein n=1 Tax=Tricholomella constricta TaxID=117010 RepID=A0A8H5HAN5_9AGAR|nr:hypothetical protein D9615_005674 [Tricholomella constricta]